MAGWIGDPFFVATLFGFVVLLAGIVKPSETMTRAKDSRLPLARIQSATFRLPHKANTVARFEIEVARGRPFTLTIITSTDLATVKGDLLPLPRLGFRGEVA